MPIESYADPTCDLSRIHLSPEAKALWERVRDECGTFERGDVFSPAADELVTWGVVMRFDLGPLWKMMRSLRGMQWALTQKQAA